MNLDLNIDRIKEFLIKQPILRAWVFGSYARGEQTENSDVDILVDFDKSQKFGLLQYAAIINDLEEIVGRKIDLVDSTRVYPNIRKYIDQDKILIYERS